MRSRAERLRRKNIIFIYDLNDEFVLYCILLYDSILTFTFTFKSNNNYLK